MKKAFTMIELIFVIVIIGILAAVAIPKLAANRIDAEASICVMEVAQLNRELSNFYTKVGHNIFHSEEVSKMTNIRIIGTSVDMITGIIDDTSATVGIEYQCTGTKIAKMTYYYIDATKRYKLKIHLYEGVTPASVEAVERLKKNLQVDNSNDKLYTL